MKHTRAQGSKIAPGTIAASDRSFQPLWASTIPGINKPTPIAVQRPRNMSLREKPGSGKSIPMRSISKDDSMVLNGVFLISLWWGIVVNDVFCKIASQTRQVCRSRGLRIEWICLVFFRFHSRLHRPPWQYQQYRESYSLWFVDCFWKAMSDEIDTEIAPGQLQVRIAEPVRFGLR